MKISYRFSLLFMVVMSVGLFVSNHLLGVSYTDPKFSSSFLPTYYVLVPLSIFAYIKHKKPLGNHRSRLRYFLPSFLPLFLMAIFTLSQKAEWSLAFFIPLIDACFVGISEELVYRGLVFTNITEEKGLFKGILFSALAFSILHSINVIGGVTFPNMMSQLVSTFIAGLFFALVYYETKNIYLVIAYHIFWDYMLLTDITTRFPLMNIAYLFLSVLEWVVVIILLLKYRKEKRFITR